MVGSTSWCPKTLPKLVQFSSLTIGFIVDIYIYIELYNYTHIINIYIYIIYIQYFCQPTSIIGGHLVDRGMGLKTVIAKSELGPSWIGIPNSLYVDGDMLPSGKQT